MIGTLALTACDQAAMQRDIYASRADCAADWSGTPTNCEPVRDAHTGIWHYYGPSYLYGSRPMMGTGGKSRAIGTHVSRGGFGAIGGGRGSGS